MHQCIVPDWRRASVRAACRHSTVGVVCRHTTPEPRVTWATMRLCFAQARGVEHVLGLRPFPATGAWTGVVAIDAQLRRDARPTPHRDARRSRLPDHGCRFLPILLTDAGTAVAGACRMGGLQARRVGVFENIVHEPGRLCYRLAHQLRKHDRLARSLKGASVEVGRSMRLSRREYACSALFKPHAQGKWLADLQGLARLRLSCLGIRQVYGNDGSEAWCTVSNPSRFFSHRRDRVSGRFAACIWLG